MKKLSNLDLIAVASICALILDAAPSVSQVKYFIFKAYLSYTSLKDPE